MARLDVHAFGLLIGVLWGLCVLGLGLTAKGSGRGGRLVKLLATVYRGYAPAWPGSLIGGLWGFFDGGIGGILIAWLYNKFAK